MSKNTYLNSTEELIKHINGDLPNESLIILDSALEQFQLHSNFNASHVYLEVSEETKNLETIEKIWEIMFLSNLKRSDEVVIIGGGVMLDLCSFAASTYKRGVAFTLVPSTLLAMVDASHGGKNGFNNVHGKNQIGTFNLPKSVVVCFELLNTLKDNDYKDGLIELVKHGLIGSKEIFNLSLIHI